jgi:hypothetical protein
LIVSKPQEFLIYVRLKTKPEEGTMTEAGAKRLVSKLLSGQHVTGPEMVKVDALRVTDCIEEAPKS